METGKAQASTVLSLISNSKLHSLSAPPFTLASDASFTTWDTSERGSTTFVVIGNNLTFAATLSHPNPSGILHGEAYGILSTSLATHKNQIRTSSQATPTLFSDHLNSIKTLSTTSSQHIVKSNPACSLYQWIISIWDSMHHPPCLVHVKAHTCSSSISAHLNHHADYVASTSHHHQKPSLLPSALVPTFSMDSYVLYSHSLGFIESNIPVFISDLLSKLWPVDFKACHELLPVLTTFDDTSPPSYPYGKATSAYSTVVQLYSRSGQL